MYDIKIFIENDWSFGARVKADKEIIYWVWKNHDELIRNLKDGMELAFQEKKISQNTTRLISFLDNNKKELLCH